MRGWCSVLVADNILWSGKVVQPIARSDRHTQAVVEFNRMVSEDPRVENVIIPLRDGLNLIRVNKPGNSRERDFFVPFGKNQQRWN